VEVEVQPPFDWSLCDWTADDPFAHVPAAPAAGGASEATARNALQTLLSSQLTALDRAHPEAASTSRPSSDSSEAKAVQGSSTACDNAAADYRQGYRRLLKDALDALCPIGGEVERAVPVEPQSKRTRLT